MDVQLVLTVISRLIVLFLAIPIHETAHAYISYRLGDPTAKAMGRLTLNPLKHIDPVGALCMLTTGIGWAKPVPVDPRYYRDRKGGMALSALAGPVSNLLLAFVSLILSKIFLWINLALSPSGQGVVFWLYYIFYLVSIINISLGIFNLLPVPPFDGSKIFGAVLPERVYFGIMRYERYIFIGIFALLMLGVLDAPLAAANSFVFGLLDVLTRFVDKAMSSLLF